MRWLLGLWLIFLAPLSQAKELGFDTPTKTSTRKLGHSNLVTPPAPIQETCWAFPEFTLVWAEDPGIKGIESVSVRRGKGPEDLCAAKSAANTQKIGIEGHWPLAVTGNYLIVQSEPFGNLAAFNVLDLNSGKQLFSSQRETGSDFVVSKSGEAISLRCRMGLELPCAPATKDSACWQKIREANKIPVSVEVAMPDCEPAYQKEPSIRKEPRGLAISVPVKVPNLAQPQVQYENGKADCSALP